MNTYPFSAITGLEDLKLALLINAVSPAVGGVLVRGEKGTAKSTIVRGLAALLPDVAVVADCRFSCDPQAPDPQCPDGPHGEDDGTLVRSARLVELPWAGHLPSLERPEEITRLILDALSAG